MPDSVLRKAGPRDDAQLSSCPVAKWQIMRTHSQGGLRLWSAHSRAHWIADAGGAHHERFDGRDYPGGRVSPSPR